MGPERDCSARAVGPDCDGWRGGVVQAGEAVITTSATASMISEPDLNVVRDRDVGIGGLNSERGSMAATRLHIVRREWNWEQAQIREPGSDAGGRWEFVIQQRRHGNRDPRQGG